MKEANNQNESNQDSTKYAESEFKSKSMKIYSDDSFRDINQTKKDAKTRDEANMWRTIALVVAVLSTIASIAIGIVETVVAQVEDSSAALGLAVTAILDALTSIVVCWRFYNSADIVSRRKEHIGSIIFGILIICSSIATAGKCIFSLIEGDTVDMSEKSEQTILITSIASAVTCFIIGTTNVVIAKKLSSWVIFSDAVDSFVGGIIAASMIIESVVTESDPYYWFLDDVVGLVATALLLVYGIWLLIKHVRGVQRMKGYEETK